jgi:hypothetical protein
VDGSHEECVTTVERDFKELLESACSNHAYPIKHKLKECTMMKNFMTSGDHSKGKKPKGDLGKKGPTPFPGEEAVISIYGGPVPHESRCKLKITSQEVNALSLATPSYLQWSKFWSLLIEQITRIASLNRGGFPS